MNGWSELGAILGGGKQLRQQAYDMGITQGARQADLLEQARARRDQNLGLQAITPEAVSAAQTDPGTAAELVSAMFHAKVDPRQLSGFQKDQQGIGFRNDAMAAALNPGVDLDSLNRRLMVINGKPVDLTHVADGVAYNPMMGPHSQTINPTQIGLAEIMLRGAQAAQANAGARRNDAQARLASTKADAGGFAPSSKESKPTLPAISALGAALGQGYDPKTGQVTIPPEKMREFLAWQADKAATDPRYNNGAYALQHYASEAPLGTGIHDQPEDVGALSLDSMIAPPSIKPPAATSERGAAPKKGKTPTPGVLEDGYIFKGGDPSKKENWVKASDLQLQAAQ
jgi:hypothetical protein